MLYGQYEGRLPGPLAVGFDESYYLNEYPDVAAAVNDGTYISGFEHYALFGYFEGRFPHAQTPVVSGTTSAASETSPNPETTLAAQLVPDLTITDADTDTFTGATVTMTDPQSLDYMTLGNGYTINSGEVHDGGSTDTGVMFSSVNNGTTLIFSGSASSAVYEGVLDSIAFYTTGGDSTDTRHISVVITAGTGASSSADIFPVTFPEGIPVVTGGTTSAAVSNPDDVTIAAQLAPNLMLYDPNNVNLTGATISYNSDSIDVMSLEGLYTVNGSDHVLDDGTDTGVTVTGNDSSSLSFVGSALKSVYQGILNAIRFYTATGDTTSTRHVTVAITDADSQTSAGDEFDVVFPVQTPALTGSTSVESISSPDADTTLAAQFQPDLSILDRDSADMSGATVAYDAPVSGDTLSLGSGYTIVSGEVHNPGSADTGISISGNDTDSLIFSGTASQATYEGVLNAVVFYTTSQDTADSRQIDATVTDTNSMTSLTDSFSITFAPVAPTVTGSTTSAVVVSPDPSTTTPAQLTPDLMIVDPSTASLTGAVVTLTTNVQSGDTMTLGNGYTVVSSEVLAGGSTDTGIALSGNNTNALTFSGTASLATYEGVLNSILFYTTSGDVTDLRGVSVAVTDANSLTSTADDFSFSFPAAPTVTGSTTATTVASPALGTISAQMTPNLSATDSSAVTSGEITITNAQTGDTMAIGNGFTVNGSNEVYDNFNNPTSLTVSGNGTSTLTFTGQAAASVYAEVFNAVVFHTTSGDIADTRDISVTISDDFGLTSAADTFDVTFPALPTVTGSTTSASPTLDSGNGAVNVAQVLPNVTLGSSTTILHATVSMTTLGQRGLHPFWKADTRSTEAI